MRRLPLALVSLLIALPYASSACSSDEAAPVPPDAGEAASAGDGQAGTQPAGGGGDAGNGSALPEGGSAEGGNSAQGGMQQGGGTPPVGDAGASSEAGSQSQGTAGAGGAEQAYPPDLITSSGGPWPDSLSANCATASALIVCPQLGDRFFGQDGTYRINVPVFTSTATTLTDSVTGLVWQLNPEATLKAHASALSYCADLDLAGQTDWRLPSRLEYVSLLDEGMESGYAMPSVVPILTTGEHWTSSATGTTADAYFVVNDSDGTWTIAVDSTTSMARCVRGTALSGALQIGADSVIDGMTDLEWQRTSLDDTDRDWEAALDYCESLEHAGKGDWRLPSIKELATIVDETAAESLVIDSATFGDSQAWRYWSSTPAISFSSERFALVLETTFGSSPSIKMTELAAARCVRTAD